MPIPPTNISPETAYNLTGLLPLNDTIDLTGLSNPQKVWFKFTLSGQFALSTWIAEDPNYRPRIKYYLGLPSDPSLNVLQNGTRLVEFFIEQSIGIAKTGTIYISVENVYTAPGATPATALAIRIETIPNVACPIGSIFISNDVPSYPATIVNQSGTHGAQQRSFTPNGESAAILANGKSLWATGTSGEDYTELTLYNANFQELVTLNWSVRNNLRAPISSNRVDTFYLAAQNKITTVTSAGILGITTWTVATASTLYFIHPSMLDNDIIYVKTWDGICKFHKSTQVLDTAFIPYDLGVHPARWEMNGFYGEEFVVMDDDTIVCLYTANPSNTDHRGKLIYYDTDGSVISETFSDHEDVNRIAFGPEVSVATTSGPTPFVIFRTVVEWSYSIDFESIFVTRDAQGNTTYFTVRMTTTGSGYTVTDFDIPDEMFGVAESCPLLITTTPLLPYGEEGPVDPPDPPIPTTGGIYFINPIKAARHDTYYTIEKKIPNPTIKTALIGE